MFICLSFVLFRWLLLVVSEAEKRERPPGSEPGGLGGEVLTLVLRLPRTEVPGAPLGRRGHCHERRDGGRDVGVRQISGGGKHECAAATAEIRGHARRTPRTGYTGAGDGETRLTGHVGPVKHRRCHWSRLSSSGCGFQGNHAGVTRVKEVSVTTTNGLTPPCSPSPQASTLAHLTRSTRSDG